MCTVPILEFEVVFGYLAHLGGNFNNGSKAGLFYWNLNDDFGWSNLNGGARELIVKVIIKYAVHTIFLSPSSKSCRDWIDLVEKSKSQ